MKLRDSTVHQQMDEFCRLARQAVAGERALIVIRAHDDDEPREGLGCLLLYDNREEMPQDEEIAQLLVDLLRAASSVTQHIDAKLFVQYADGKMTEFKNDDAGTMKLLAIAAQEPRMVILGDLMEEDS